MGIEKDDGLRRETINDLNRVVFGRIKKGQSRFLLLSRYLININK